MLEESELQKIRRPLPVSDASQSAERRPEELVERLSSLRVSVRLLACSAGPTAGGVTLRVPVGDVCSGLLSSEHLFRHLCMLVRESVPVTLALECPGQGDEAVNRLEDFCAVLRRTLAAENLEAGSIGLSLRSGVMPLHSFLLVCTALLGDGPRFTLLDERHMRHHEDGKLQDEIDHDWSFLWRRRGSSSPLLPVYATNVTTRCSLLNAERATSVLPQLAIQAPASSAWLPLELRLVDFSDGRGKLRWDRLQKALRACVDVGDRLLDHLVWPEAGQRADACLNRRLAVCVGGIGDLVVERGADPADLRTLQWIDRLMLRVSKILWSRSQARAKRTGVLPALLHSDPTSRRAMPRRDDWQRRWRVAVAKSAVRHRNLLVMSPYSVLPAAGHDVTDFIDLLPVLHHADAFSFCDPTTHGCRSADEFAAFHRRAFAVMERRNAISLVATGA